jgi:hypothetical protein
MSWPKYVLLGWYVLSALVTIHSIDKPAKTMTPERAMVVMVFLGMLVALVVMA